MTEFTPYSALIGGFVIGFAAFLLLYLNGKIAGISGIFSQVIFNPKLNWQIFFIIGLVIGPILVNPFDFKLPSDINGSWLAIISGGLLVGFGSRLGSGCTSGHGICGIGRWSIRSIVATCCFMGSAVATVFIIRHVIGG